MNIMEGVFEMRSCIEILANDIKIDIYDLQEYKVYILGDLHHLRGKTMTEASQHTVLKWLHILNMLTAERHILVMKCLGTAAPM